MATANFIQEKELATVQLRPGVRKPPLILGSLVCLTWIVLGLYDTGFSDFIPGKAIVRYALVLALCSTAFFTTIANRGRHYFRALFHAVALALLVGLLSTFLGKSIPLGLIKLVLYAIILIPLIYFGIAGRILLDDGVIQKMLVLIGLFFVAVAVYRGSAEADQGIDNANHISALVLIALPLIQFDQVSRKPILGRQVARFALLLAILAVILNHSRGAVAGVGVMVGAWVAVRHGPSIRRFLTFLITGIVLLVLLAKISFVVNDYLYKGGETLVDDARQSEFELFQDTFSQRPFLGYGFGLSSRVSPEDFEVVLETWRLSYLVGEFGNSSLAIMSGGGALLFAVFLYIFWKFYRGVWLALRTEFQHDGLSLEYRKLAILFCATLGFLVHSQAEAWLMAPVTLPTFSFWFYFAGAIHISGEIFDRSWDQSNEVDTFMAA